MEVDVDCGAFVYISICLWRKDKAEPQGRVLFRDKNNTRLVVLHQWEELGFPFLFSLLSPSHPPLSPLHCIAGESPLLCDDNCSVESALWWSKICTCVTIIRAA